MVRPTPRRLVAPLLLAVASLFAILSCKKSSSEAKLLNVSYDPTRELYHDVGDAFAKAWKEKTGQAVKVDSSHGGSGKQARAVIDGLEADVVTLGLAGDIDAIANAGLVAKDWRDKFPNGAVPYTSTIVFLVRKGNPKGVKDWNDLVRPDVQVIAPNPKTSGGARWAYLGAWGYALKQGRSDDEAKAFVAKMYANVPVLDAGARGSTVTFCEREMGDVLVGWESDALLSKKQYGDKVEVVVPSITILAETPVAIVDAVVDKRGTRAIAQAYLEFLWTKEAQEIAAKNFLRPRDPEVAKAHAGDFPAIPTFTVDELFGGWAKAHATHFADGGVFDQIYKPKS